MLKVFVGAFGLLFAAMSPSYVFDDVADCNREIKNPEIALPACQRVLQQRLTKESRYFFLLHFGTANQRLSHADVAIRAYNEAIELDPDKVNAYYLRGIAYSRAESYNKCIADFKTVLRMTTQASLIDNFSSSELVGCYLANDQTDEATEAAKHALDIDQNVENQISFARALRAGGKIEQADSISERVLLLHPSDGTILYRVVLGDLDSGNGQRALAHLQVRVANSTAMSESEFNTMKIRALRLSGRLEEAHTLASYARFKDSSEEAAIVYQQVLTLIA